MLAERVPGVNYFRKFSTIFDKQGLKWKLIITTSYFQKKNLIFFLQNFDFFYREIYYFYVNIFSNGLFSAKIYVWF